MTAYSPKGFADATQYPTALTPVVDNLGNARGRFNIVTTAAGATATHGTLDIDYDTIIFKTGAASTATLPVGVDGQELTMVMHTDGGDMVVTCAALLGGNTITFDGTDSITAKYDGVTGVWIPINTYTAAITTV